MPVIYDPDNFPPERANDVEFNAVSNSIFGKYHEETETDTYYAAINRVGQNVGASIMANVSDFDKTIEIAGGMNDRNGLMLCLANMRASFMEGVIEGAKEEGVARLEYQAIDASNLIAPLT